MESGIIHKYQIMLKINKTDTSDNDWNKYWKLWKNNLNKHPNVYIEATLNNTFAYYDPLYFFHGMNAYQLYNKESLTNSDAYITYSEYALDGSIQQAAIDGAYAWEKIPLLSFAVNPGFCFWLGFILFVGLIRKKEWRSLSVFVAPFMTFLICIASPVNGLTRYTLPNMSIAPLLILITLLPYINNKRIEEI